MLSSRLLVPHSGTAKTQRELGKTVNYFRAPSSAWEARMRGDLEGGIDLFCVGKLTDGENASAVVAIISKRVAAV